MDLCQLLDRCLLCCWKLLKWTSSLVFVSFDCCHTAHGALPLPAGFEEGLET